MVLYIDASDDTMKKRLMKRGETSGRVDDNEETIKQRLNTFHEATKPVIDHYAKQGKVKRINSERNPNDVFVDVEKALKGEPIEEAHGKIDFSKIDQTVDHIVQNVLNQASHRQKVEDDVCLSITNAIKDIILHEMKPNRENGFSFVEYDNLEIYHGPSRLFDFIDSEHLLDESTQTNNADSDANNNNSNKNSNNKLLSAQNYFNDDSIKHGEIIIRCHKGQKVLVKADEHNDTVISNIEYGEIIIRNVDTNLVLTVAKGNKVLDPVELCVVGQAYIKDLTGSIKAIQFKGIVVVKTDL